MDEVSDPAMSILAEGHQWYWSYQYPDFLNSDEWIYRIWFIFSTRIWLRRG